MRVLGGGRRRAEAGECEDEAEVAVVSSLLNSVGSTSDSELDI